MLPFSDTLCRYPLVYFFKLDNWTPWGRPACSLRTRGVGRNTPERCGFDGDVVPSPDARMCASQGRPHPPLIFGNMCGPNLFQQHAYSVSAELFRFV